MKKFICTVCGYIYEGETAPEKCPLCKAPASKFKEMEETADRRMPFIILCFRHMSITKILILLLPVSPLRPALRAYETSQQIH